jgi:hypothetical protein
MVQPIPIQVPPKKAAGFWTPWGNVRVPDLDAALEKKAVRSGKLPPNAVTVEPKPAVPTRRG